jgi:predicted enzyme related to lactoylglutathione lyase
MPMTNLWPAADAGAAGPLLCWRIDDMQEALRLVGELGGSAEPVETQPFGLLVMCTDDQGMRFGMWEPTEESKAAVAGVDRASLPRNGTRAGDISYMTLEVVDSARARAFFGRVLGWRFRPGRVADGWGVDDVVPMHGLSGGSARAVAVAQFRVDDIAAAVERIRAAGGSSTDPQRHDYGWSAECVDDQGIRFYLGQM